MKIFGASIFVVALIIQHSVAPPVNEKKKEKKDKEVETNEIDQQAYDVEYKRYLQEVVNVLEGDENFRTILQKADPDDVKSGKIASELQFVNHHVRTKLDELKRQELERLRRLALIEYEQKNGIDRKHMIKLPGHLDARNPHSFESEDLKKLILQTTKELEDADQKRKNEFKEYEMKKELQYQEQLKHLDEKNRVEAEKQHQEMLQKHKKHQPLHHPGSKPQLEEVWEEQDHMSPEDFNPKTFFHLHDLDGNGVWDTNEVKALFKKELDKMYDPNAPEDDMKERQEEMERMREHVFNETDTNKDHLISYEEFLEQTKRQEFEKDEGWDPIEEQPVYSEQEYQQYARDHEAEIRQMIDQGLIPAAPPGYVPVIIPQDSQHHGVPQSIPNIGAHAPLQQIDSHAQPPQHGTQTHQVQGHGGGHSQQTGNVQPSHAANIPPQQPLPGGAPYVPHPNSQYHPQQFQAPPQHGQIQGNPQQHQFQGQQANHPQQVAYQGDPHSAQRNVPQRQHYQDFQQQQQQQPYHQQQQPYHHQQQGGQAQQAYNAPVQPGKPVAQHPNEVQAPPVNSQQFQERAPAPPVPKDPQGSVDLHNTQSSSPASSSH